MSCHTVHVQKKCGKIGIEGSKVHLTNPFMVRSKCVVAHRRFCGSQGSIEGSKVHLTNPFMVRSKCAVGSLQVVQQLE